MAAYQAICYRLLLFILVVVQRHEADSAFRCLLIPIDAILVLLLLYRCLLLLLLQRPRKAHR